MDSLVVAVAKKCKRQDPTNPDNGQKDIYVQLALSFALGLSAFIGFCILRPRWKTLYAARKRFSDAATDLPELPDSFLGWLPVLYKVTEQQVLASAGLDAYVFLAFFKMAIRLFSILFFLACTVFIPIHSHFYHFVPTPGNSTDPHQPPEFYAQLLNMINQEYMGSKEDKGALLEDTTWLYTYLVFTYVFTGLTLYLMITQTKRIIQIRQDYLGSQSTVTDRTLKLSGIPPELRSEDKIKDFLEKLQIGSVESVTLCRNWKTLDQLIEKRSSTVRRLEEAWTVHLGAGRPKLNMPSRSPQSEVINDDDEADQHESDTLMRGNHVTEYENPRPTTRIWYGFLGWQSRKVDAIDYYEEKLRKLDEKIIAARKKEYAATPLAFVTMDSIPACQMAIQAVLDPEPMQLLATQAPAPSDIVWQNTYIPRTNRMARSWTITMFIIVLTVFWLIPVALLAGLLDLCSISQVWPGLATFLRSHSIIQSLVQTGLPTLVVSLLNIAVPFLYDYLSNQQGMVSQGDVELAVISKNFFFTIFNLFLVFTVFGTANELWIVLRDSIQKSPSTLAYAIARKVQDLAVFYTNFILLQGVGLFPFRLLEFGSVSLYPIMLMGSKTPRDYAELVQPPIFKYGFYLPTALLVFILCMVYSILPAGYMVLFFGLIYFIFGYYTYKYQLLYAMDHPQHATGKAWPMICYRILLGLGIFQFVMAGIIALLKAFTAAALVVPLIPFTIWFSYYFGNTYEPLMKYISLRSIRRESEADINIAGENIGIYRPPGYIRRLSTTIDEEREQGLKFMNPSLTAPLHKIWINKKDDSSGDNPQDAPENGLDREESAASSVSLGDTHIWRDNGDANV